jgi:hypothetical protein
MPNLTGKHSNLFSLAKPYLDKNDFGTSHTERVLAIAQKEFKIPPEIEDLTVATIILHDIGGATIKDQYEKGPQIAEALLRQLGYSDEFIGKVCEIIRTHHERLENPGEAFRILFDSDQLVRFSEEEFPYYEEHHINWDTIIGKMYLEKMKTKAMETLKKRKSERAKV